MKDLEDWFRGGPWGSPGVDFHAYWLDVFEGRREAEPFLRFGYGDHELSHLVLCDDEDVLCPYWGSSPIGDPYQELTSEPDLEVEVRCVYLGFLIFQSEEYGPKTPEELYDSHHALFPRTIVDQEERVLRLLREVSARFPTRESAWAEVQRKYALVGRILEAT